MKQFLKKILSYGFIVMIASVLLSCITFNATPDLYEQFEMDALIRKTEVFNNSAKNYNTVFIGSSRIYHHINTPQFDSITQNTTSFNLAVGGLFPLRSMEYVDYLSENLNHDIKYAFVELSFLSIVADNYKVPFYTYDYSFANYRQILSMIWISNYSKKFKLNYFFQYTRLFLYKYLGFGSSKYWEDSFKELSKEEVKNEMYWKDNGGFISYDFLRDKEEALEKRYQQFRKNGDKILERRAKSSQIPKKLAKQPDDLYMAYIKEKLDKLAAKGIEVMIIVPPRQHKEHLHYLMAIQNYLKDYPSINVFDSNDYPEFFELKYAHDKGHLNEAGARILTKEVARKFMELKGK
ncbi:MAG: hypothetical protein AAGK97_01965 [Bacteroidota bacterium]